MFYSKLKQGLLTAPKWVLKKITMWKAVNLRNHTIDANSSVYSSDKREFRAIRVNLILDRGCCVHVCNSVTQLESNTTWMCVNIVFQAAVGRRWLSTWMFGTGRGLMSGGKNGSQESCQLVTARRGGGGRVEVRRVAWGVELTAHSPAALGIVHTQGGGSLLSGHTHGWAFTRRTGIIPASYSRALCSGKQARREETWLSNGRNTHHAFSVQCCKNAVIQEDISMCRCKRSLHPNNTALFKPRLADFFL